MPRKQSDDFTIRLVVGQMVTIDKVVKVVKVVKMVTIDMDAMDQTHRLHPTLGQGR